MESCYYSENFYYRDSHLICEDVQVNGVLSEGENQGLFSSPVFIFSKKQIVQNVYEYRRALIKTGLPFVLNYAMKANANLELLKIFRDLDCSLTLVSGNELKMALEAGFDPQKMMLNGNGKRDWEIELGIRHGCLVNIDSGFDLTRMTAKAQELDIPVRVLIRINPDIDPVSMGVLTPVIYTGCIRAV